MWIWSPSKLFQFVNERPMYSVPIEYICPRRTPSGENINERKKAIKRHWGAVEHTYSIETVYLWSLTSEPILSIVCLISLNLIIFTSTSIPGVYGWNIIFRHFYRTGHFLMRSCDVLELVFDELFCSNVDNNCVLTFDWFLSELTICLDANKGTNFSVGGQLLDA